MRKVLFISAFLSSIVASAQYPLGPQSEYPIVRAGIQIGADTLVTQAKWKALWDLLNAKQSTANMVTTLSGATNSTYPTSLTVLNAISAAGGGNMHTSTYDTDGDGIPDNAESLGGTAASSYLLSATASSTYVPLARTINGQALSANLTLTTTNIGEGTNLYFTDSRARGAITLTTTGSGAATYNSTTGALNIPTAAGMTIDATLTDGSTNAIQNNAVFDALALKAALAGPTFTGTVTLPSTTSIGTVSSAEINYLDNVSSNIQTQLNTKLSSNQTITFTPTGDVTGTTSGSTSLTPTLTIGANAVTLGKIAQIATSTFLGRSTASTGNVEALTVTQATAMLNTFTSALKGLVPAPTTATGKYLKDDGTWDTPAGGGGLTDGDKGDITVASSGASLSVDAGSITGTKLSSTVAIPSGATATTQAALTNNTSIATTAFVYSRLGYVNVKDYGATGDGSTNDQAAIAAAITAMIAGQTLYFPPGSYLVSSTVSISKAINILGEPGASIKVTSNISAFTLAANGVKIDKLSFVGSGKSGVHTSQMGIHCNGYYYFAIRNCDFTGINGIGLYWLNTTVASDRYGGQVEGCKFFDNNIGFQSGASGEYVTVTGVQAKGNNTGGIIIGGNVAIANSNISDNTDIGLEWRTGTNNGHGSVTGTMLNHNGNYALKIHDVALGVSFTGCQIFDGGVWLKNTVGVLFSGCEIALDNLFLENSTATHFSNNTLYTGYGFTINNNYNSTTSKTFWVNNHLLSGSGGIVAGTDLTTITTATAVLDVRGTLSPTSNAFSMYDQTASSAFLKVTDGTSVANQFVPQIWAKAEGTGASKFGLYLYAEPGEDGSDDGGVLIQSRLNGAALTSASPLRIDNFTTELLELKSTGALQLAAYASGTTLTGTASKYAAFDASGNMIAVDGSAGSQWTTSGSFIYYNNPVSVGKTSNAATLDVSTALSSSSVVAFQVTDNTASGGYLKVTEATSTVGHFIPTIWAKGIGTGAADRVGLFQIAEPGEDGADDAAHVLNARLGTAALANADILRIQNYTTQVFKIAANGTMTSSSLTGTGSRLMLASSTGAMSAITNGTNGHVMTLVGGVPTWAAATGGTGEANTASNIGTGGVGVYATKSSVDLQFRNISAGVGTDVTLATQNIVISNKAYDEYESYTATTTGATAVELAPAITISNSSSGWIQAEISGVKSDGTAISGGTINIQWRKDGSGNVVVDGLETFTASEISGAIWNAAIESGKPSIELHGVASTTIFWTVVMKTKVNETSF